MRGSKEFLKAFICAALFLPIVYIGNFIHEMGHSVAVLVLGGRVLEFMVSVDGGRVLFDGVSMNNLWLVGIMGGLAMSIYYGVLAEKINRFLYVPVICSLVYAFYEMQWIVTDNEVLYNNMLFVNTFAVLSTLFILSIDVVWKHPRLQKYFIALELK
jgi:hypothetical protein